ncbi:glyoxylate reductase [Sugiyamaella lignohabitans]|uniref:Glyoxylate reductase n=1 Tax=Sugiyamaella lignohabitans TaxID=796027 RepID=A0A167CQI0_9ASCO|nr:glyoxylate reductase [Sugiyamaella lignohabitans]ANB11985.1 glyoxylate reductase [Sugiyamaella lignohabitans]
MTASVRPKILLLGVVHFIDKDILKRYESEFELINYDITTKEDLISKLETEFNDIVAIATVWFSFVPVGGLHDEKLLNALPKTLKVIATPTVGVDLYNLDALTKRGIVLANSAGITSDDVADIALHLSLSAYRFTSLFENSLRTHRNTLSARYVVEDQFDKAAGRASSEDVSAKRKMVYGHLVGNYKVDSPKGQVAGIVGFGSIGRAIAKRLAVLGMKIHYLKRSPLTESEIEELGGTGSTPPFEITRHETFDSLAKVSNLLVLVVPLTSDTRHILNERTIALLPDAARVVNVGRGPLIDQKALIKALESGKLSSAGLDVYEQEPLIEPALAERHDVTLLPHIGSCTDESAQAALENCFVNIKDVVLGSGKARNSVN